MLICVNVFRGNKKSSYFGVKTCSVPYWSSLIGFMIMMIGITYLSVRRLRYEQWLKKNYGDGLKPGDVEINNNTLTKLLFWSFIGGWTSGAFGLGGGAVLNPLLLSFGLPPKVASATGMYMAIFATCSSTIEYMLNHMFIPSYSFWIATWCIVGSIVGMKSMDYIMNKL